MAEIPGTGSRFLNTAVQLVNANLRGTLGANIIIDPASKRQLGAALRDAIAGLRYGTIAVNAWTGVGYLTPRATWGAFPGHDLTDIQSGRGMVHNALLLSGTERTVVTGPFRPAPRSLLHGEASLSPLPPWFVNNKTAATTGRPADRLRRPSPMAPPARDLRIRHARMTPRPASAPQGGEDQAAPAIQRCTGGNP